MKAISQPTVAPARELRGYTGARSLPRFSPALRAEGVLARPFGQCRNYCDGCIFEILLLDIGDRMGITKRKYVRYRSKSRTQVEKSRTHTPNEKRREINGRAGAASSDHLCSLLYVLQDQVPFIDTHIRPIDLARNASAAAPPNARSKVTCWTWPYSCIGLAETRQNSPE